MDKGKIIIGVLGAVVGWFLKETRDYVARHSESHNALYRLHNELSSIRVSIVSAQNLLENANALRSQDIQQAEQAAQSAYALIRALPPIRVFDEKYDAISRSLTEREKEMARNVVYYYNSMRNAYPDKKPDVESGVYLFEGLISARRRMTKPFAWMKPKERALAKAEARSAVDDFFSAMQA